MPEVASRHHLELVNAVVTAALDEAGNGLAEVEAIAVTQGPGLIGALLVGLSTAKALAAAHRKPLIPADHLHGHVAANFLEPDPLEPPFLCLIASGGHTLLAGVREHASYETLGATARRRRRRGLRQGRPAARPRLSGRPAIQRAAEGGDAQAFDFPVAMSERGLDFSFSGLKTSLVYRVRDLGRRGDASAAGPTSPPPSRGRSSISSSPSSGAPRGPASGPRSRSAGVWPRTPSCASAPRRSATSSACGSSSSRSRSAPTTRR